MKKSIYHQALATKAQSHEEKKMREIYEFETDESDSTLPSGSSRKPSGMLSPKNGDDVLCEGRLWHRALMSPTPAPLAPPATLSKPDRVRRADVSQTQCGASVRDWAAYPPSGCCSNIAGSIGLLDRQTAPHRVNGGDSRMHRAPLSPMRYWAA